MAQKISDLVHEGGTFSVFKRQLIVNCELFEDDLTLLATRYPVRSSVSAAHFQLFENALEGSDPELTHENAPDLKLLCDEFKFSELGRKIEASTDRLTSVVLCFMATKSDRPLKMNPYRTLSLKNFTCLRSQVELRAVTRNSFSRSQTSSGLPTRSARRFRKRVSECFWLRSKGRQRKSGWGMHSTSSH
jgi:hypothetical protein